MYAGDEGGEDEDVRRVRRDEREGRRGGVDEPFLIQFVWLSLRVGYLYIFLSFLKLFFFFFLVDERGRGRK